MHGEICHFKQFKSTVSLSKEVFFIFIYSRYEFRFSLKDFKLLFILSEPPFHLTRRGWGEFPVRIQIHFKDPRNKRIDIIHQLKVSVSYGSSL